MMDRFKFRVWDKCLDEYISEAFLDQCFLNMNGEVVWWSADGFEKLSPEKHIVEFCTGEPDLKGKLIFEGDEIQYGGKNNVSVIREMDGSFGLSHNIAGRKTVRALELFSMQAYHENTIEIIGTIHEK